MASTPHASTALSALAAMSSIPETPARVVASNPAKPSRDNDPAIIFGAFDALQSQAAILDHDGTILFVNEAWRQFGLQNGYAGDDLAVGRNYLHQADCAILDDMGNEFKVRAALESVLAGTSSGFYGEYRCDSPREGRHFSVHAGPFLAGDKIGALIVHTNITTRRLAMAELEAEREILESIAGGAALDQVLTHLSAVFERLLFGCRCASAALIPDIASFHAVNGTPEAARVFDRLARLSLSQRLRVTGEMCAQEDVIDLATLGEALADEHGKVAKELSATPGMLLTVRDKERRPIGLIAILDRTIFTLSAMESALAQRLCSIAGIAILSAASRDALRQSEERYALAFQGAHDGLWDWDMRSDEVFRSARCYEILGYKPDAKGADQPGDHPWWLEQIHPDDLDMASAAFDQSLVRGDSSYSVEYRIKRADGTYLWILDRGAFVRSGDGQPYRAAGSITDISARKLAEQQRRVLEAQLRQIQKSEALGTLAGGIAHDINNTLMPIIGSVDMLLEDSKSVEATDSLQDIRDAAMKIQDLVEQILAFSRKGTSDQQATDLVAEVRGALRMLRSLVPSTTSLKFEPMLENLTVAINRSQIHQVMMGLIGNAASAIGDIRGSIRIVIDRAEVSAPRKIADRRISPGLFCRITVVDTGHGIAADAMPRVFDPFFKAKGPNEGSDLGLSILQGIVLEHDGFIEVSNEPGAGARFDVYLPAC